MKTGIHGGGTSRSRGRAGRGRWNLNHLALDLGSAFRAAFCFNSDGAQTHTEEQDHHHHPKHWFFS
ncbi:hypothetical protein [Eubacterium barkeri]|uniref:hypothetical protein n=1 Tax=Eubacterium barkeri TaxID=1528 RepID=UPI00115FC0DE|nr:hypothetical protein [Eubacterium barkeri]